MPPLPIHPPLFCKVASSPKILFSKQVNRVKRKISFRSLQIQTDLPRIHEWVNQEYAHEYWQLNGAFSQLFTIYQCMEHNPFAQSFIGLLNDAMVCQFDVYSVFADELREHIDPEMHDSGFHLLMAPNERPIHGLTTSVVECFLHYYFSFSKARRMYAEPDVSNAKSIALLERCGFQRLKTIQMSYKKAHVYCLPREMFFNRH
jgi:RimJ/RimL family protein N-acetyltransferase